MSVQKQEFSIDEFLEMSEHSLKIILKSMWEENRLPEYVLILERRFRVNNDREEFNSVSLLYGHCRETTILSESCKGIREVVAIIPITIPVIYKEEKIIFVGRKSESEGLALHVYTANGWTKIDVY
ncbi:MAG: hypothetical protein J7K82_08870 [Thermoproteales archaeon]|nr:hypothetical protein [Thermoproteales archaeon]